MANGRARRGGPSEPRSPQVASTVAPTGLFDRPSRAKSARTRFFDRLFRPKWLEKGVGKRFWSILDRFGVDFGSIWGPLGIDFDALSLDRADSLEGEAKKRRLTKNLTKHCVLRVRTHVAAFAAFACTSRKFLKIDSKSFRTGFSSELRNRSLSERSFFKLGSDKMVPEGSPERLERRLGTLPGALWALLGRSWALSGRSWGTLGGSWVSLGMSWVALRRFWVAVGGALG